MQINKENAKQHMPKHFFRCVGQGFVGP